MIQNEEGNYRICQLIIYDYSGVCRDVEWEPEPAAIEKKPVTQFIRDLEQRTATLTLARESTSFSVTVVDFLYALQKVTIKKFEKKHGKLSKKYDSFEEIDHQSKDYKRISKYALFQTVDRLSDPSLLGIFQLRPSFVGPHKRKHFYEAIQMYEEFHQLYAMLDDPEPCFDSLATTFTIFEQMQEDGKLIKMIDKFVKKFNKKFKVVY